ncbi:DMT family transporter [Amycolatopsis anabasis]|uniref:DMT family transporter n=1 Tax=Amycolatopsis anabasis TaxID=1840409 RepID=UPI00131B60E1|nr:DMT family transporter [Amycolatopsis anabasis]
MPNRSWLPGFLVLGLIWGASFALIKIGVSAGVGPVWIALWRCFFGALALWLICAVRRSELPRGRAVWGHAAVVALLANSVPFALFAFGETRISSVVAGVWNAATPLMTTVFALLLLRDERPTPGRLAGLAFGLTGVLVVLGVGQDTELGSVVGSLACLGATACYGAGFAYTRRFLSGRAHSAVALSAAQISCATGQLALVAPLAEGAPSWPGFGPMAALVVLGAVGTGVAFLLNFTVIRAAGSTVASTVTYVTPLWSTAIGAVFLAEPIGWNIVAGGVLIVAGVALSRGRARPASTRPEAAPRRVRS